MFMFPISSGFVENNISPDLEKAFNLANPKSSFSVFIAFNISESNAPLVNSPVSALR